MPRITASHIVTWVDTHAKEAQTSLPRLIRRLCYEPGVTTQLSFPAGDSTYRPGWDGQLQSERGDAWIPAGKSCWEIGCDQDVTGKANGEYSKRTGQVDDAERLTTTFVFVSPRRWSKKKAWLDECRKKKEWADVRVFDADDLEQWLEQRPDVALQFADEIGLGGWGVESPERYWRNWSQQCHPAITMDSLFVDRSQTQNLLIAKIEEAVHRNNSVVLALRADSETEGAAYAVACISTKPELLNIALVVTEREGWQYVEANHQLRIVVAARSEVAAAPTLRQGLVLVVPQAIGNIDGRESERQISLPRPNIYEFEKALATIGVEASDAKRLAQSTGHSWSVFRRVCATNPAIRRPAWMDVQESSTLAVLCLMGAWSDSHDADRQVIQRLAGKSYDEVERDLRFLSQLDDAPTLQIGSVWKAKSPLELLYLSGGLITRTQLDGFFGLAQEILSAPDPQLELPDSERYAAQLHRKVRPNSALLIDSLCDTLIKLAVHGPDIASLQALNIEPRIDKLVSGLLGNADGERWLSLASHLPALAEAAPEVFLRAVEASLNSAGAPVTRLITETGESGMFGRCWHASLLWALETLAWSPKYLTRVALVLARLCHVPMKGNWGNKPAASLFGLFRTWFPQTAADIKQRINVLDALIQKEPDIAFQMLEGLAQFRPGSEWASPAAHPKWRDDNAGAGNGVSETEIWDMINAARERLLSCSNGNAQRIATIIDNLRISDLDELAPVLTMAEHFVRDDANDGDREVIRAALRAKLHWHRNYDARPPEILESVLDPINAFYERLAPKDLLIRHRWLFSSHWPHPPVRTRDENPAEKGSWVPNTRLQSLNEIYAALGMMGVERMIRECSNPELVGATLADMGWSEHERVNWIVRNGGSFASGEPVSRCISGLLFATTGAQSTALVDAVLSKGIELGWSDEAKAQLILLARFERPTWDVVDSQGAEVSHFYWSRVNGWGGQDDKGTLDYVLRQFLDAKRPRSALHYCQHRLDQTDAQLLFEALQRITLGEEPQGHLPDPWYLGEMFGRLERSGEVERMALARLEFTLFPALGYGQESRAGALYEAITSEPAVFCELICAAYKPDHGDQDGTPPTESVRLAATTAWSLLHNCTRQPGTLPDGSVDPAAFTKFIADARDLCRQADRISICDITLGQILARGLPDEEGLWPFAPARLILDSPEMENMRNGFHTGARNKRGVTTRGMLDGGEQERTLAGEYRKLAEPLRATQPYVAALLDEIARSYDHDAKHLDVEASLRREGV